MNGRNLHERQARNPHACEEPPCTRRPSQEREPAPTQPKKRFLADAGAGPSATEIAKSLYKIPALLTTWTRCGKPRCRCREGQLHGPYHALYWRDGAAQRRRYVRAADVAEVRAILAKRREHRHLMRLGHALSLRSWRELGRLVQECEARMHQEWEHR